MYKNNERIFSSTVPSLGCLQRWIHNIKIIAEIYKLIFILYTVVSTRNKNINLKFWSMSVNSNSTTIMSDEDSDNLASFSCPSARWLTNLISIIIFNFSELQFWKCTTTFSIKWSDRNNVIKWVTYMLFQNWDNHFKQWWKHLFPGMIQSFLSNIYKSCFYSNYYKFRNSLWVHTT